MEAKPETRGREKAQKRTKRLEVRWTADERALIDRAAREAGIELSQFAVANLVLAAQRVLADRTEFFLDAEEQKLWGELNSRPARELPGLRRLMARPSPFVD